MNTLKVYQKITIVFLIILLLPKAYMFFAKIITNKLQPTFFGYASAVVVGESMSGTVEINAYIITKAQTEYNVNDIVMFVSPSGRSLVTHRIVAIVENGIQTKGDANNAPDNYITPKDKIIGKVVCIMPKIGLLFAIISSPWSILVVFVIGLLIIELPTIIKKIKSKQGKEEDNTEEEKNTKEEKSTKEEDKGKQKNKSEKEGKSKQEVKSKQEIKGKQKEKKDNKGKKE